MLKTGLEQTSVQNVLWVVDNWTTGQWIAPDSKGWHPPLPARLVLIWESPWARCSLIKFEHDAAIRWNLVIETHPIELIWVIAYWDCDISPKSWLWSCYVSPLHKQKRRGGHPPEDWIVICVAAYRDFSVFNSLSSVCSFCQGQIWIFSSIYRLIVLDMFMQDKAK